MGDNSLLSEFYGIPFASVLVFIRMPSFSLSYYRDFYLYQAFILQLDESFSIPIPMITLLTSGKLAGGKQNLIKEVLILPQPGTPMQKVSCKCVVVVVVVVVVIVITVLACLLSRCVAMLFCKLP